MCLSDTHGNLRDEILKDIPNYDAFMLLGDHTNGDIEKVLEVVPKEKLYGILGNHDTDWMTKYDIKPIEGEVNGIEVIGFSGSAVYKDDPTQLVWSQDSAIREVEEMPCADILFSHDGTYRMDWDYAHRGLYGITKYIYQNQVPYNIHGHIHINEEKMHINGCKEIAIEANRIFVLKI